MGVYNQYADNADGLDASMDFKQPLFDEPGDMEEYDPDFGGKPSHHAAEAYSPPGANSPPNTYQAGAGRYGAAPAYPPQSNDAATFQPGAGSYGGSSSGYKPRGNATNEDDTFV